MKCRWHKKGMGKYSEVRMERRFNWKIKGPTQEIPPQAEVAQRYSNFYEYVYTPMEHVLLALYVRLFESLRCPFVYKM